MPEKTNGETASSIKQKIKDNKKFILLATENAISSKWYNWELGHRDAEKFIEHIALLPVRNKNQYYTGSEYMQIYPSIEYIDVTRKTVADQIIPAGYYVLYPADEKGTQTYFSWKQWLLK